jgi:hypothetical protein
MFRAMWLNIPGLIFVVGLCCLDGLVIFAVYADCDLKKSKKVTSNDQVYTYSPISFLGITSRIIYPIRSVFLGHFSNDE